MIENRRLLCDAAGLEAEQATMVWQQHGPRVVEAEADGGVVQAGFRHPPADGLYTEEPGLGTIVLAADCLPVALVRCVQNGERPGLALLHVGRGGLLAGIVRSGVAALGRGELAAVIGPGIGPCCYEVGDEVAAPFRSRFGEKVLRGRHLDLWRATELELRAEGVREVDRTDLCTACAPERFFSHRRDRGDTGRQGAIAYIT